MMSRGWEKIFCCLVLLFSEPCLGEEAGPPFSSTEKSIRSLTNQLDVPVQGTHSWYFSFQNGIETDPRSGMNNRNRDQNRFPDFSFSNGASPVIIQRGNSFFIGSDDRAAEFNSRWMENQAARDPRLRNGREGSLPAGIPGSEGKRGMPETRPFNFGTSRFQKNPAVPREPGAEALKRGYPLFKPPVPLPGEQLSEP